MDRFSRDLTETIKLKLQKELQDTKDFKKITGKNIDRDFKIDLNDLTISELDFEMRKRASSIRDQFNPGVYLNRKAGRNKLQKICLLIPFLFHFIFKGSVGILKDFMFFNNAMLIRMKKNDEKFSELEEKIAALKDETE